MQQNGRMIDTSRFAIMAAGEHVWTLARDLKDQNFMAPFQLNCRRTDNGEVIWRSADLPEYATFDLVGRPLLADGKLFITAKTKRTRSNNRASRSSSSWRSSRTMANCSGRPRSARSAKAQQYSTTTCATRRPSRG